MSASLRQKAAMAYKRTSFPYRPPSTPGGVEPLAKRSRLGSDYDTSWARRYPARVARVMIVEGLMRPAVAVLATPERIGLDRLAGLTGPAIFAANHHSHVDTPLMLTSIPEPWRHKLFVGAAADYFFHTRHNGAISALAMGAIPIERTKVERSSAYLAASLIDEGWSMLIFPEGGRSPDGWGQPFRGGAAYLALRCKVPVVPIHIEGTGRILRKGNKLPKPATTRITFGSPLYARDGEDSRRLNVRIERAVEALADEASSDWWTARQRAYRGDTPSLSGPDAAGSSWRRLWALPDSGLRRRQKRTWPE